MEYEDICLALKNETEKKEIVPFSISFFEDVTVYLKELEKEMEKCDNPRSVEHIMLSNELNTAIERIEEIIFLRKNKIFSMAALSVQIERTRHKNYDRLLPDEKTMYDSLVHEGKRLMERLLQAIRDPVSEQPEKEVQTC